MINRGHLALLVAAAEVINVVKTQMREDLRSDPEDPLGLLTEASIKVHRVISHLHQLLDCVDGR
jgi:hypothetical protein